MKTENRMLKNEKKTKTAAHFKDTKTEKPEIFSAKTEKPISKITTVKPKTPMPLLLLKNI